LDDKKGDSAFHFFAKSARPFFYRPDALIRSQPAFGEASIAILVRLYIPFAECPSGLYSVF
jgi:hypothetical protein